MPTLFNPEPLKKKWQWNLKETNREGIKIHHQNTKIGPTLGLSKIA